MGKVILIVIMAGALCYIIWRIYEAFADPYGYGNKMKGLSIRTGIALSSIADAFIVYAAINYLLGIGNIEENEQLNEQRRMVQNLLLEKSGQLITVSIGVVIAITALVQLVYGITKGYRERLEVEKFTPSMRKLVHFLGITGYISRGVIIGIVAFFYIKAGILNDAQTIVNTDKAFDFVGDNIGHIYFIILAVGTVCYGIFMFALGVSYDIDKD